MTHGDRVAVFDARRDRWRPARIISFVDRSAVVWFAPGAWSVVPLVPSWVRAMYVVQT